MLYELLRKMGLIRRSDMYLILEERQSKIIQLRKRIKSLESSLHVRRQTSVVTSGRKEH